MPSTFSMREPGYVSCVVSADGQATVRLHGEHDIATSAGLGVALAGAWAATTDDVLVDLSEVTFMGAATVSALIAAGVGCSTDGRALVLQSPSTRARRLLDVCGVRYEHLTAATSDGAARTDLADLAAESTAGP
jgi:anti-anti-sigma factor